MVDVRPSSRAGPGQMRVNVAAGFKERGSVCTLLPRWGMWHESHGGAGGFPHLRSGAPLRSGEGGAHAVEEGMMDGEEVGGRV